MRLIKTAGAPTHRLLVCLDLHQAALPGEDEAWEGHVRRCVANCRRVLGHARAWDWSIVHVHPRSAFRTPAAPIAGLEPRPTEPVMLRDGVSAFSNLSFRALAAGARRAEMVLIGLSFSASGLATLFSAHDFGLPAVVVEDAVCAEPAAGSRSWSSEALLLEIAAPFARTVSADQLIGSLRALRLVAMS